MKKINYIVYMHISPNNKRYIGITSTHPKERWANGKGYKYNKYFYRAIEKYGWDNFEHIIVAKDLTDEEAKWLEVELIKIWDTTNKDKGYNVSPGGDIVSEESKQRMSENHADVNGENNPFYGKCHSEKSKEKIGKANGGKNHPQARMIVLLNTKEIFLTIKEGAEKYNLHNSDILMCCQGKLKSSGRLEDDSPMVWMYYDEYLNIKEEEIEKKLKKADTRVILLNTKEIFSTATEGARKYKVPQGNVTNCCKGKLKSAGKHPITDEKLIWMYYIDYKVI